MDQLVPGTHERVSFHHIHLGELSDQQEQLAVEIHCFSSNHTPATLLSPVTYVHGTPAKETIPAPKCLVGAPWASHKATYLPQVHQHLSCSIKIFLEGLGCAAHRTHDAVDSPASQQQKICSHALVSSACPRGWQSKGSLSSTCTESRRRWTECKEHTRY